MFTGLESPTHLIIVLVVVLLLFGAKRIPELAKGLGAGVREFKKGAEGNGEEEKEHDRGHLEARAEDGHPDAEGIKDERVS